MTVECQTSLDDTVVPLNYFCSYNNGPLEDCKLQPASYAKFHQSTCVGGPGPEISLPVDQFPPGIAVQLEVTITTPGGQSGTSTISFTPPRGW